MVGRRPSARPKILVFYCIFIFVLSLYTIVGIQRLRNTDIIGRLKTRLNLEPPDDITCYYREKAENVTYEKEAKFEMNSIFMISTSCDSSLPIYAACAIEAVVNSQADKYVYVLSTEPIKDFGHNNIILQGVTSQRVFLVNILIDEFVEDTPLKGIFDDNFLNIGIKRNKRVLEVLKIATLYKYGGTVVDLEMILAKPFDFLGYNWAGKVNSSRLGSAVLALKKKSSFGLKLLETTMQILLNNKDAEYLDSGLALTQAFRKLCYGDPVEGCSHFRIYDPSFFYSFNSTNGKKLFENGMLQPKAFGYYIWDKDQVRRSEDSVYMKVMAEYCPSVLKYW